MATLTQPRRRSGAAALSSPDAGSASPSSLFLVPPTPPSMPTTPRSTVGSPLSSNATRRSGGGDLAAGRRRRVSMSEVELMPWLCCMAPALWHTCLISAVVLSCMFFPMAFVVLTTALTFWTGVFFVTLGIGAVYGAHKLRQGTHVDWHARLEDLWNDDPTLIDVSHIVLLPNYMENERMLKATLENLGRSPMARSRTRIVLAMEAREGAAGREKADRLIQQTSHLFADIFATYHPQDLPGEVAGKSSNTQWAYRQALHRTGPILLGSDPSRVFLTVADADTLFHSQYLSAITYQALTMSDHERSWSIWQAPVFLLRNFFSVPELTKATATSTLVFELSSMCKWFLPAFAFSSYTVSLALASHPEVDGWDTDVIAEDHHMTCKCFFAALWELFHEQQNARKSMTGGGGSAEVPAILPQLRVRDVPLPSLNYLVESPDGFWPSISARFQQGRRHMQGIVEIGYIFLQYSRLVQQAGFSDIPARTHFQVFLMLLKLISVCFITNAHGLAVILGTTLRVVPPVVSWILQGTVMDNIFAVLGSTVAAMSDASLTTVVASLANFALGAFLYVYTSYTVIRDLVEGRYHEVLGQVTHDIAPVAEGDESMPSANSTSSPTLQEGGSDAVHTEREDGIPDVVRGPMTWLEGQWLHLQISVNTNVFGFPSMLLFAIIPSVMACLSLLRRGTDFEYIVAAKPE